MASYVILSTRENVVCEDSEGFTVGGLKREALVFGGERGGEDIDLLGAIKGGAGLHNDLFSHTFGDNLSANLGLDDVGLVVEHLHERFFFVLFAWRHHIGKQQLHVEDVLTAFLMAVLGVKVGQFLIATFLLHLVGQFTLLLILGFEQLFWGTLVGQSTVVDRELNLLRNVVFTGIGLSPREYALG